MMNFKINFDILKNKIARLNSLVPSTNNSNEYSHITQSTDQHNYDKDMRFSSSRHFDDNQMRQTSSYFNKPKVISDFEHAGNNINITDYHTLIYNNNAILLESKNNNLNKNNKRIEKDKKREKDMNRDVNYINDGSFNIYSNRNTIKYSAFNMETGNFVGNLNNTNDFHCDLNRNNINYEHKRSPNQEINNIHHGNNVNMNLNLNNIYLNTSLTCGELITDTVAQFTITPKNLDQHGAFDFSVNNKSIVGKSKANSNSKSSSTSSFNMSDIVDEILEMKNTPVKIDNKIDIELDRCNLDGFDINKDLCNAETTKGIKLFRNLYTKNFNTVYDRSKDKNFFNNLNLKVKQECVLKENCVNLEYLIQPLKSEIINLREIHTNFTDKTQELSDKRVICDMIRNSSVFDNNENNLIVTKEDKEEIVNSPLKSDKLQFSEPNNIKNKEITDDISNNNIKECENHAICEGNLETNQQVYVMNTREKHSKDFDKIKSESLNKETEFKSESNSNNIFLNDNQINMTENNVKYEQNWNYVQNENEKKNEINYDNEISPNKNKTIETNLLPDPEDEEDIEADMILNEIIKNSKLKYEQEKSQLISQSNKEVETQPQKAEEKTFTYNYLKCEEEKIEIKESPKNIVEKSLDDSLIFADADIDPNIDFDIKDQLCSDRNSFKIIEDIIEESMVGDENNYNYIQEEIEKENNPMSQTDTNQVKDLTIECSNIEQKNNLTADIIKNNGRKINNTKFSKKFPVKKNVTISDKVLKIIYEHKSYVPNLYQKKSDGSLLKLKIRDIDEYLRKIYKNKKPKSILKKKLPEVDEKELALKRLNDLIIEYDNSKESETVNNSKSVLTAEKKRIVDRNKKFIQQIESAHKSGKKFRSLNPKLIQAKKKKESENLCNKFKSNPHKFFSKPPCQVVLKSMNLKTENNSAQNLNSNKSDNTPNGKITTDNIAKVFGSQENTPDKIQKGKILMEIINNINIEDNLRELEMDSKVLTHNTFSNLSWISDANTVEKEFLYGSPEKEMRLDTENEE